MARFVEVKKDANKSSGVSFVFDVEDKKLEKYSEMGYKPINSNYKIDKNLLEDDAPDWIKELREKD